MTNEGTIRVDPMDNELAKAALDKITALQARVAELEGELAKGRGEKPQAKEVGVFKNARFGENSIAVGPGKTAEMEFTLDAAIDKAIQAHGLKKKD
jgi:hypothetical protein